MMSFTDNDVIHSIVVSELDHTTLIDTLKTRTMEYYGAS